MGKCPECGRWNGHSNGCPMANVLESIIGRCAICGEPIYEWDFRVENLTEDWEYLHPICLDKLIDEHLVSGD